jgi:branched-chain amino acid transport system substrate-binding protein
MRRKKRDSRISAVKLFFCFAVLIPWRANSQADPIKIALITDESGALELYGLEQEYGLRLGLDYATEGTMEIAGRPVEIVLRDYENDPALVETQARDLIENEGVDILVGAPSSAATETLIALASEYNVILMMGPATDPRLTEELAAPMTFRVCANADQMARAAAIGTMQEDNTFVQIAPDHAFGYAWTAAYERAYLTQGATFAANPIYIPTDTENFGPYWQQAVDSGADRFIITWIGSSTGALFQQALEAGIEPEQIITGFYSNDMTHVFSSLAEIGVVGPIIYHYSLPDNPVNNWLVEQHRTIYNDVPDQFTECGFSTGQALAYALDQTNGSTAPSALIQALETLQWDGPKGHYTMEDHQAVMPIYIVRLISIDDPDQSYYELVNEIIP